MFIQVCLLALVSLAMAKTCPKIETVSDVSAEALQGHTGKKWYTPWVGAALQANLIKSHFMQFVKTTNGGETMAEMKAKFPKFWDSYCGLYVFNNQKNSMAMNAFGMNSTLTWEDKSSAAVALFHNPAKNGLLNLFEGIVRTIVWTDNETNYLIVLCFPNGVMNWVVYSRNKVLTPDVEQIIRDEIDKFPLDPIRKEPVKYSYKNCK